MHNKRYRVIILYSLETFTLVLYKSHQLDFTLGITHQFQS